MTADPQVRADLGADSDLVRRAIASTPRPPRPSALSQSLAFAWRGMLKVKHVPEQLLDVTITPVMFVLMFTYLFGGAIAGSSLVIAAAWARFRPLHAAGLATAGIAAAVGQAWFLRQAARDKTLGVPKGMGGARGARGSA